MSKEILIADDDPVVRHLLSAVLRGAGFIVAEVQDGNSCLKFIRERSESGTLPSLVLLDLQLEDLTGAEVLEGIRASTSPIHLPVVMLSANSEDEVRATFPSLDADCFLSKPFPPDTVLEIIDRFTK